MADKQINDLPSGGALQDADLLVLQRSGTAMNILGSQLAKASDITTLQTNVADRVDKTITVTSIRDFLADSNNGIGAYILNVQNATDNPRGTGNVASAIMYKHTAGGGYSEIFVFSQGRMWVSANTVASEPPETITWTEFAAINTFPSLEHMQVYSNPSNATTFAISGLIGISTTNRYRVGLLYCAEATKYLLAIIFINTGNSSVVIHNVGGDYRTFTGSVSNNILTLTANSTVYGGIRILWID